MNRREFLEVSGAITTSGGLAWASPPAVSPVKPDKASSYHVGVEYYRAPMPPMEMWDEDFATIKKAGFDSVRTFTSWNWMAPEPGRIELGDFDRMFELAARHGPEGHLRLHAVDPHGLSRLDDAQAPGHAGGLPHRGSGRALRQLRRRAGRQSTLFRPSHVESLRRRGAAGGGQPLQGFAGHGHVGGLGRSRSSGDGQRREPARLELLLRPHPSQVPAVAEAALHPGAVEPAPGDAIPDLGGCGGSPVQEPAHGHAAVPAVPL